MFSTPFRQNLAKCPLIVTSVELLLVITGITSQTCLHRRTGSGSVKNAERYDNRRISTATPVYRLLRYHSDCRVFYKGQNSAYDVFA